MKTPITIVLYFIISISPSWQLSMLVPSTCQNSTNCTSASNSTITVLMQSPGYKSPFSCSGNGIVTFVNRATQPLWLYYWYAEDIARGADECRFRRLWKQLAEGNNQFTIPINTTLIFRICTSKVCADSAIKQYGIVQYCSVNNGTIQVK